MGDRAGEGRTYGNLGNTYQSQGAFSKAIKDQPQHLIRKPEVPVRHMSLSNARVACRVGDAHLIRKPGVPDGSTQMGIWR